MIYYIVIGLTYAGLLVTLIGGAIFLRKKSRLGKALILVGILMLLFGAIPLFKFISESQEKAKIQQE